MVVSAYLPYDSEAPPPLERIVELCEREKIPLLIGTDSNSHHVIWSSSNTNLRGEQLVQFMMSKELVVVNSGRRVSDEETFSDHKLIKFRLRGIFPNREPYRNSRKTNWNLYRAWLKSKLDIMTHQEKYLSIEDLEKANRQEFCVE